MSNIFLFTGEEQYLLDAELHRRAEWFVQKYGNDTVSVYDSQNFDTDQILQEIFGGGLFVTKKMVIIKGFPLDTLNKVPAPKITALYDAIESRLGEISADVFLIFASYKPDKRTAAYKTLKKSAQTKEFDPKNTNRIQFVKQEVQPLQISSDVAEYILMKVWTDLYRIHYELDKITTRCTYNDITQITKTHVDELTFGMVETNIFTFSDYLLDDADKAVAVLEGIQEDGMSWYQFLGTLYRTLKAIIYINDYADHGQTNSKYLASVLKLHPFVVSKYSKNIDQLQKFAIPLKKFYKQVVQLDAAIKTGKMPDTGFWISLKRYIYELHRFN